MKPDLEIDDARMIRFIRQLIQTAIEQNASDIHCEPYAHGYRIRLRKDGLLEEVTAPSYHQGSRLASCLKIMAQCDIAEKRIPQDGRFGFKGSSLSLRDIRMSTCPTLFGEKIVLRLLDPTQTHREIESLGFEEDQQALLLKALERPQGIVLITGPTGSGKTTTLYSALQRLNSVERNICTVEDPIEIVLRGINQVNINPKAGLHFSTALRAFLRQDPDIIMVGEMRDLETAEIALKAAQTGHLVLSTLHTNSAAETLTRLMHMGIPAYYLATTVTCVIAQRLVRRLCEHCKDLQVSKQDDPQSLIYEPVGCQHCHQGYRGRVGIFEVMPVSSKMRQIMIEGGNAHHLAAQMHQEQWPHLRAMGLRKVQRGITSLAEIDRVTPDDTDF